MYTYIPKQRYNHHSPLIDSFLRILFGEQEDLPQHVCHLLLSKHLSRCSLCAHVYSLCWYSLCSHMYSLCSHMYSLCSRMYSLCGRMYSLCSRMYSLCGHMYSLCSHMYSLYSHMYSLCSHMYSTYVQFNVYTHTVMHIYTVVPS